VAPSPSQPQALVGGRCYTPVSAPGELIHLPTATLRFTTPEATLTLTGCAFTFTLKGDAKGLIEVEFSGPFDGYTVSEPVEPADPPSGSPWPSAGLKALGAPLSYDDTTTPCAGFTFTLGSRIAPMADLGAPNGRAGFYIADRDGQAFDFKIIQRYIGLQCLESGRKRLECHDPGPRTKALADQSIKPLVRADVHNHGVGAKQLFPKRNGY
jgi:hypothetical protein